MKGEEPAEQVAKSLGEDAQKAYELASNFQERLYAHLDDDFMSSSCRSGLIACLAVLRRM